MFMAFGPITSWQIDGEITETVRDFILGDSKITADVEIKRCLLLGRKAMTNLDSILKRNVFAWRIPGTGEPVGLPPMGSHRIRHDLMRLSSSNEIGRAHV